MLSSSNCLVMLLLEDACGTECSAFVLDNQLVENA